jgi:hypothetical protein
MIGLTADSVELLFELVTEGAELSFELVNVKAKLRNNFISMGEIGNRGFPRVFILGRDKLEFGEFVAKGLLPGAEGGPFCLVGAMSFADRRFEGAYPTARRPRKDHVGLCQGALRLEKGVVPKRE